MNFYPYLEKSYHASQSWFLFFIANASLILLSFIFLFGWYLWYDSFFLVFQQTLKNTSVSGDIAGTLIAQAYHIGSSLIILLPIVLLAWRVSIPYTYSQLNLLEGSRPWWKILLFDVLKLLATIVVFYLIKYLVQQGSWLGVILLALFILILLSIVRYYETIYFSSAHNHSFVSILKSWFLHLSHILFLHSLDFVILILGFCLLGIFLASFTYLPFWLGSCILYALLFIWGKLMLIWKGLWSYAAYALLTDTNSSA